jgi:hypothetical protein
MSTTKYMLVDMTHVDILHKMTVILSTNLVSMRAKHMKNLMTYEHKQKEFHDIQPSLKL